MTPTLGSGHGRVYAQLCAAIDLPGLGAFAQSMHLTTMSQLHETRPDRTDTRLVVVLRPDLGEREELLAAREVAGVYARSGWMRNRLAEPWVTTAAGLGNYLRVATADAGCAAVIDSQLLFGEPLSVDECHTSSSSRPSCISDGCLRLYLAVNFALTDCLLQPSDGLSPECESAVVRLLRLLLWRLLRVHISLANDVLAVAASHLGVLAWQGTDRDVAWRLWHDLSDIAHRYLPADEVGSGATSTVQWTEWHSDMLPLGERIVVMCGPDDRSSVAAALSHHWHSRQRVALLPTAMMLPILRRVFPFGALGLRPHGAEVVVPPTDLECEAHRILARWTVGWRHWYADAVRRGGGSRVSLLYRCLAVASAADALTGGSVRSSPDDVAARAMRGEGWEGLRDLLQRPRAGGGWLHRVPQLAGSLPRQAGGDEELPPG